MENTPINRRESNAGTNSNQQQQRYADMVTGAAK